MRSVGVLTLGCKVNTYESEYVIHLLKNAGYEIKNFLHFLHGSSALLFYLSIAKKGKKNKSIN